jgi:cytochrome c peroxidase
LSFNEFQTRQRPRSPVGQRCSGAGRTQEEIVNIDCPRRDMGILAAGLLGWLLAAPVAGEEAGALTERARSVFGTPPAEASSEQNPVTEAKVSLGRMLYYDPRLSKSGEISCNSCHVLEGYGVDGEPTSPGHEGQRGDRNSPSVYYAAFHVAQFWDGRAADVEEQAKGPVLNPVEMALPDAAAVEAILRSIPGYAALFQAAFPDDEQPVTFDNFGLAVGAFERRLVTPSPFDRFLAGDASALSAEQQAGLATFMDTGCITCHNGALVGGAQYQKLGLVHAYPDDDPGRQKVTGREADRQVFKVPSLRNVEKTGPYFHDGSVTELSDAVRKMAHHQLGLELSEADANAILVFLGSLTGQIDAAYVAKPELPN